MSPLDYFLWGYLRDKVFKEPVTNLNSLVQKIEAELMKIAGTDMLKNAISSLPRRCQMCKDNEGSHFENYL